MAGLYEAKLPITVQAALKDTADIVTLPCAVVEYELRKVWAINACQ